MEVILISTTMWWCHKGLNKKQKNSYLDQLVYIGRMDRLWIEQGNCTRLRGFVLHSLRLEHICQHMDLYIWWEEQIIIKHGKMWKFDCKLPIVHAVLVWTTVNVI